MLNLVFVLLVGAEEEFHMNENPELEIVEIVLIEKTEEALIKFVENEIKEIVSIDKSFKQIEQ